jgi:hypothetical protein
MMLLGEVELGRRGWRAAAPEYLRPSGYGDGQLESTVLQHIQRESRIIKGRGIDFDA